MIPGNFSHAGRLYEIMETSKSTHAQVLAAKQPVSLFPVVLGALALLAGCSSEPESHVVSAPPPPAPQVVVTQPAQAVAVAPAAQPGTIIVTQAPPAVQQEMMPAQPSSEHKWIAGYWTWRDNRYEWVSGHWEVPPSSGAVWVAPRWERLSDGSYRFYEGYWN